MNQMSITFSSRSENESVARVTVASFVSQLNPTLNELTEIKTVVSEAVTNSIIHGYKEDPNHFITISCQIKNNKVYLKVSYKGEGIEDIEQAKEPLLTSKPKLERTGMGLTIMENFLNSLTLISTIHKQTKIEM